MKPVIATLMLAVLFGSELARGEAPKAEPAGPTMRVRVTALEPEQPVRIIYSWGGQGIGGQNRRVELPLLAVKKAELLPGAKAGKAHDEPAAMPDELKADPAAVDTERDGKGAVYLKPGRWSMPAEVSGLPRGFVQFSLEGLKGGEITHVRMEFEFIDKGKVIDRVEEHGDIGPIVTLLIGAGDASAADWAEHTMGLREYVEKRADALEALAWAKRPVPRNITFLTDCGGYGTGGYGVRHSSADILRAEARCLVQMGVNSLRGGYATMLPFMREQQTMGAFFGGRIEVHADYHPVTPVKMNHTTGKIVSAADGAGCPWYAGTEERAQTQAAECVKTLAAMDNREVWALTDDEIGSIFDGAPEGKPHMSVCPVCLDAFRAWLKGKGLTPEDLGCKNWDQVRNITYPDARLWSDTQADQKRAAEKVKKALPSAPSAPGAAGKARDAAVDQGDDEKPTEAEADAAAPIVDSPGRRRLAFYSWQFNCYSTAHTYKPLADAFEAHNRAKRAAMEKGDANDPLMKQAFLYSFALRGNTFLLGDHSLDFFDFYREADNAMVYETSNRDGRVFEWDSYLCDVGRSLELHMGKKFGVYVKPHRGAPIQRALAGLARGAELIFWYTYGPDYAKGDSYSSSIETIGAVSKAARIIGASEDALVGAVWTTPARVAVVRGRTESSAEWEDGKWLYTALQHSHVPVDALDQVMLAAEDLTRYKIIYVTGGQIRRESALALRRYVEAGGTIYTGAGGMSVDESGSRVKEMEEVLGVSERVPVELWCDPIRRYKGSALETFGAFTAPPTGAGSVAGEGVTFDVVVGREKIKPLATAVVKAKFADGSPALTVNTFGKGQAYHSALFGGLEYAVKVHRADYDMVNDFDAGRRSFIAGPALLLAPPVVAVSVPTVEAIALSEPKSGRRSVVVINWTYEGKRTVVPCSEVKITIANAAGISGVKSAWLDKELPVQREGDKLIVTYPVLEEGDVLTLH